MCPKVLPEQHHHCKSSFPKVTFHFSPPKFCTSQKFPIIPPFSGKEHKIPKPLCCLASLTKINKWEKTVVNFRQQPNYRFPISNYQAPSSLPTTTAKINIFCDKASQTLSPKDPGQHTIESPNHCVGHHCVGHCLGHKAAKDEVKKT